MLLRGCPSWMETTPKPTPVDGLGDAGSLAKPPVQSILANGEKPPACALPASSLEDGVHEDRRCGIIHSDRKDPAAVRSCSVSSATIQDG